MKKENIYVEITNETERLRAIEILQNAGEEIRNDYTSDFKLVMNFKYVVLSECGWWISSLTENRTKITLDELETLLKPKKSNVFTEVQEWIRENAPEEFFVFRQGKDPDCLVKLQQHLENDYPQGTEIKISKDKIEIYHS
jgi:hypothetical protein